MLFLNNINSVAKYESKILIRSWFFKVFTVLAVLLLFGFNFVLLVENNGPDWLAKAIPSTIPYMNLLLLNTGQAVIAIFLSSEFLKRDKKLDTSEVFYVRPLSNAEYVIGKIWGNLRVFLILNLIILGMTLVFNYAAKEAPVDLFAYLEYFLIISIPTLIFIIGLSIFLMLILKNQALTFILLLGYIGLTIFYIQEKFYYLFDYMAYSLPQLKSSIAGFTGVDIIINHRSIYFFLGTAFIFFTIFLFRRLPNARHSHYPWLFASVCAFALGGTAAYKHIKTNLDATNYRLLYTEINNKYVHSPKMIVDNYDVLVEQQEEELITETALKGTALETSNKFTFCLNPGLMVTQIKSNGKELKYTRDNQIIIVDFEQTIAAGDSVHLTINSKGKINETFCYLDIPAEELQKQRSYFIANIGKRYVFQNKDYLLITPETYWYPRPGTSYSDKSPDWQQTYFSNFNLQVKPLPGLIPLSQGVSVTDSTSGLFTFSPQSPLQSISLIIGDYKQKSVDVDSVSYNIWYIDGHDFFSAPFDSILDTIPHQIRNMRDNLQRQYKLSYPFNRFSVVEIPAQFFSYTRSWTQAQETMQPEMVLFPEKGYSFWEVDFNQRIKDQKRWGSWDGREISDEEAKIRALNNFFWIFLQTQGDYSFSSGSRGQGNITSSPNPLFVFPQLYNFRYNIFSPEWPISNRLIELYLQKKNDNFGWEREINGISNSEKANLLMVRQSFKDLLADNKQRGLIDNIVALRANKLFSRSELNIGTKAFRDSTFAVLERNTFRNIQFEALLDTLGSISKTELNSQLKEWVVPVNLPLYTIGKPQVTQIKTRDKEVFLIEILLSNNSDYDGIVNMSTPSAGRYNPAADTNERMIEIPANQTKRIVLQRDDSPRSVDINTIVSGNLPNFIYQPVQNIKRENRQEVEPEGEHIVPYALQSTPGEIIVDNEDSLFSLSAPEQTGLLLKWMDKVADSTFKYSGVSSWRAPIQWTATTNARYYGKFIRSAYVVKSGKGNQTATWKVPISETGQYEVYYYVCKPDEIRWNWNSDVQAETHFKILYDNEAEDAFINLRKAEDGWEQLGVYYFDTDTVKVVLTNDSKLRSVSADAVKFVKR